MKAFAGKFAVALLSAFGAALCLLNASGAKLFCVTKGCHIYSGYGLFGISFYVFGLVGFLLILLLALLHPRLGSPFWLPAVLALALALEILFLVYQFLFWPCVSCLVVGILIVLAAISAVLLMPIKGRLLLWTLSGIWTVLFIYVGLAALKEAAFTPWAIAGNPEAPVKIFFSPICPACKEAVTRVLEDPALSAKTAFFPVAKNARDEARIAAFLQRKSPERTIAALFEELPEEARLTAGQKWRLQVNKMALARMGAATVPFITAPFLPLPGPVELPTMELPPPDSPFAPPQELPFSSPSGTAAPSPTAGCSAFEEAPGCDTSENLSR